MEYRIAIVKADKTQMTKKRIEVVAAVIKNNGKYFCAQRNNKGELAKKWEFPGGKVELGETQIEALKREIQEELKLDIKVENFIMTVEHEYNYFHLTMHAYLCKANVEEIILLEHLDSKWLKAEELDQLDWAAADIPIINKIKEW